MGPKLGLLRWWNDGLRSPHQRRGVQCRDMHQSPCVWRQFWPGQGLKTSVENKLKEDSKMGMDQYQGYKVLTHCQMIVEVVPKNYPSKKLESISVYQYHVESLWNIFVVPSFFEVTHQIAVASEALEIGDGQQLRRPVLLRSAAGQTQAEALGSWTVAGEIRKDTWISSWISLWTHELFHPVLRGHQG